VGAMASLITAISLNDFLEKRSASSPPRWVPVVSAAALAVWSLGHWWIWRRGGGFTAGTRSAVWMAIALALFSAAVWCVREVTGRRRTVLAGVLLFAVFTDCKVFGSGRWFNAVEGDVDNEHPGYGIGGIDDAAYRVLWRNRHYRAVTDELAGPHPVQYRLWGLATPEGFDPFLTVQYRETVQHWVRFQTNRMFNLDVKNENMLQAFGVRYVLVRDGAAHDALLAASPNFRLIGRKDVFCHVYEYLHARPPYHWERESDASVQLIAWIPERREFQVRSGRGDRFILTEQFFPGWRATVDGQPAAIERWGGAFQAIRVAAGEHRVRFEFRPASLRVGAAVSVLALTGLLATVWADWRSR
jgi:hypothetical protein